MKILAVVPARCGSKGFPNKNIAKIKGKTLLEYAIQTAKNTNIITDVYISTDCIEYESIAKSAGAKSLGLRSKKLASDTAKTVDVVIDLLKNIEESYDFIILLQPTSPIRNSEDILNMLNIIKEKNVDACVSVNKIDEPHPYKLKTIDENGFINSFLKGTSSEVPRQSLPDVYSLNGALYIIKTDIILSENTFLPINTAPYIMPSNINIDSEEDFIFLEAMVNKNKVKI